MARSGKNNVTAVYNKSGYILEFPSVLNEIDLAEGVTVNPFAEDVNQLFPLGTKAVQGDKVYRYCRNSSAGLTVIGSALQAPAGIHADCLDDIVVAASSGETYAIGSNTISLTSTTNIAAAPWSTKDGGKEGYVYINGGTGIGQCRKIKAHAAFSSTDVTLVEVYDGWTVAPIAGDTECGIIENPYYNIVVAAALTTMPVGVNPLAVTASYYFWAQTGGPAAVICHAAIPIGTMAIVGTTSGEVDPMSAFTTEVVIGYMLTPGIKDNDAAMIFLTLDT